MSLRKSTSIASLYRSVLSDGDADGPVEEEEVPSGPLSGPSTTGWRRQRLLNIGSSEIPEVPSDTPETASLRGRNTNSVSYGTLPTPSASPGRRRARLPRSILPINVSGILRRGNSVSVPVTPSGMRSPSARSFHSVARDPNLSSLFRNSNQRPISAYDAPLVKDLQAAIARSGVATPGQDVQANINVNGIRVWYSSFTSIDWLHDVIKDSVRHARLHRHKRSWRGRARLAADRSVGWLIVSIVGFITAVFAFLIVRGEQMLFDLKEGYCTQGWWKARRFCCPGQDEATMMGYVLLGGPRRAEEDICNNWVTWSEVFGAAAERRGKWMGFEAEMVEYVAYACVALTLAVVSSLLTIHLTASTSFTTRKDSGVLSPDYAATENGKSIPHAPAPTKRGVMYYAAGSGIPEIKTILSGFVIHGYLGGRTLFTKAVGLALSVASGLSLGKEGPFVHIASCVGNIVSRFFSKYENNEGKRREILSAASAAGVAVAFGAPIGGVLFSLEEVSYFFPPKVMWRSFFCAMIAAITLKFLDPFGTGKLVLFQVNYDKDWHAYELFPFLLLGVFGGVYGAIFSKLNIRWSREVRSKTWMKTHPVLEVLLITLVTTLLCFLNPYTRMGGTELVYNLFAECRPGEGLHSALCVLDPPRQAPAVISAILTALVVKGALTIVTFGIKVPAGIFIPTLGVGACAGRIMGLCVQWLLYKYPTSPLFRRCNGDLDCVIPGLYAMVGATATLSGVTRTTVSLVVIMFELTDTLTYVVPLMLAVLTSKTVADALEPKGIYDLVIGLNKLPYLDAKHDYLWGDLELREVMNGELDVIRLDRENTVKSVRDQLQGLVDAGFDDGGFPIVKKDDGDALRLVGFIGASELEHALSIVADEAESPVQFHTPEAHAYGESSVSSLWETSSYDGVDPFDFSVYMDRAPLTVQANAPPELVHQFFIKLGAKYVVVTDPDGCYEGVIDKKAWLAVIDDLETKKSH